MKYSGEWSPRIEDQNAKQNVSVTIQKSSFATQYYHSVCTKFVQSKYFAIAKVLDEIVRCTVHMQLFIRTHKSL